MNKPNCYRSYRSLLILVIFSLLLFSCGKAEKKNETEIVIDESIVVSRISGQVSAENNLADVEVSIGDKTTKSDINGFYLFKDLTTANKRLVLTFEKPGFGVYQRSILVEANKQYAINARLLRYQYEETVDLSDGKEIVVEDPNNVNKPVLVKLNLPKGSVLNGANVSVSIARGDPTTEAGRAVFPGDFMAAENPEATADTPLESIAFTEITLTTSDGTEITTLEKPATLTVRLPDVFQAEGDRKETYIPGDPTKGTIEWWSYDESRAVWIREDAKPSTDEIDDATVIMDAGVLYAQAEVTHFSWWNADRPVTQHACLCVQVVDENGDPVVGAQVIADGVTYDGRSTPVLTDANGRACLTVKRSLTTSARERVKISVQFGGVSFYYDVTNSAEGNVDSDEIYTPTQAGSTIRLPAGVCVDLSGKIELAFKGVVEGTVTKEGSNAVVPGFTLYSSFGREVKTDSSGNYSIKVPLNQPITLFSPQISSKTVTVTTQTNPMTVNFVIANIPPSIDSITRSIQGVIVNGDTVLLTATVTDRENESITYDWQLTRGTGTLGSTNSDKLNWTAPTTGAGTDTLRLIVTDASGASSEAELSIVWGQSTTGGTIFKLLIKDGETEQVMPDVTVVLYNADNKTFANSNVKISDANGVVDFGDVGTTRVTFSILSEKVDNNFEVSQVSRTISSYLDVLTVNNAVYYVDSPSGGSVLFAQDCNIINVASVDLKDVPIGSSVQVTPGAIFNAGVGTSSTISMCDYEYNQAIAKNGKVSFLISAVKYNATSFTYDFIAYGMLIDVVQDMTVTTSVLLDRTPNSVRWDNQFDDQFTIFNISGNRSGTEYEWPGPTRIKFGDVSIDGLIKIPRAFPFDGFDIFASDFSDFTTLSVNSLLSYYAASKHYTQLPNNLMLDSPTAKYTNLDYDAQTNKVTWQTSETINEDFQRISFIGKAMSTSISWNIYISETAVDWEVMNLPTIASTWVDAVDLTVKFDSITAFKTDIAMLQGIDQAWAALLTNENGDEFFDDNVTIGGTIAFRLNDVDVLSKANNSSLNNAQISRNPLQSNATLPNGLQGFLRIRH